MSGASLKVIGCAENEFIAEETLISIESFVDHPKFQFISGTFGPLEAGLPCDVPLWMAISLRKKRLCKIKVPDWMTIDNIREKIREERNSGGVFVKLPFHYIEISSLLLKYARDDMQSPEELATLLRDIEDIRMDRLKIAMVEEIANKVKNAEKVVYLNVENLSSMEILSVKRFVLESMSVFTRLTAVEPEVREVRDARGNIFAGEGMNDGSAPKRTLRKFR